MSYKYLNSDKILEHFHHKLSGIRTGRVNASVLDTILVDVYGSKLTIKELATITMPEPTQLLITPFDKNLIQDIQKAINNSTLGVNPNDDGAGIRLAFPPLTEENKKERLKRSWFKSLKNLRFQFVPTDKICSKQKKGYGKGGD
ncbi:ribosome recycling factor [Candidatus Gracilibacteria bacterium]|nr:ribosome recycling factor [Candidatus Gracilibacteria bacterium]